MFISLSKWGTTFTIKSPDQTITKNITSRQGTLIAQNSFSWYPSCMQIPMFWAIISTSWVTFTNNGRAIHIIVVVAFHVLTNTLGYLFTRTLLWHGLGTTSGKAPWFLFRLRRIHKKASLRLRSVYLFTLFMNVLHKALFICLRSSTYLQSSGYTAKE